MSFLQHLPSHCQSDLICIVWNMMSSYSFGHVNAAINLSYVLPAGYSDWYVFLLHLMGAETQSVFFTKITTWCKCLQADYYTGHTYSVDFRDAMSGICILNRSILNIQIAQTLPFFNILYLFCKRWPCKKEDFVLLCIIFMHYCFSFTKGLISRCGFI